MTDGARASSRVRLVVLAVLLMDVAWAAGLAVWLIRPPGWLLVGAVLAGHVAVHVLVLRAAVTPWLEDRTRDLLAAGLLAVTALAWPVLTPWAASGEEPWAWLVGFTVGALVALRPWAAAVGSLVGAALVVAGTAIWPGTGGSVGDGLLFAATGATVAGGLALLVVWMLRLLVAAEDGRAAQAGLAVAEERLRVSRDLHDVLGHRLGVIALRAELAGDTETQQLATTTLREVREAVHGYAALDLDEQLRGAELVLGSAGVAATVAADPVRVSPARSQLLAAAVREAVTNVLAHSDARECVIRLSDLGDLVRLTVDNDGVRPGSADGPGTGLAGLAERARPAGARLRTEPGGERFRLVVEVPCR